MAGALLSSSDRSHFLALMRRPLNSAVHRRINALLLLDDDWTAERLAEALFIKAETVREHRRRFLAEGGPGIERLRYAGHAPGLSEAQSKVLRAELSARLYLTAKDVCSFVADRLDLPYTPHAHDSRHGQAAGPHGLRVEAAEVRPRQGECRGAAGVP